MVAERILIRFVPHVYDGLATHISENLLLRSFSAPALKPQCGSEAPIGFKVLRNLAIDRPNCETKFFVLN
jgi:hypothetical protein